MTLQAWKPDKKYEVVFGYHVLAFLDPDEAVELLINAYNALTDGGLLILKENID